MLHLDLLRRPGLGHPLTGRRDHNHGHDLTIRHQPRLHRRPRRHQLARRRRPHVLLHRHHRLPRLAAPPRRTLTPAALVPRALRPGRQHRLPVFCYPAALLLLLAARAARHGGEYELGRGHALRGPTCCVGPLRSQGSTRIYGARGTGQEILAVKR